MTYHSYFNDTILISDDLLNLFLHNAPSLAGFLLMATVFVLIGRLS